MKQTVSIIIPAYNEELSLKKVVEEIQSLYPAYEIIIINNGSTDGTHNVISKLQNVRSFNLPKPNKGCALYEGLTRSTGDICITMDSDGQNDPQYIREIIDNLANTDCVCTYRIKRSNTLAKKIVSLLANKVRRVIFSKSPIRDAGSALRGIKRDHTTHLFPFEGLHRFIPDILHGFNLHIVEIPVIERSRYAGKSKYGSIRRTLYGIIHLYTVKKYLKKYAS